MCIRTDEKTMLKTIVKVQTLLLKNHESPTMWNKILSHIGKGSGASRVYIFTNEMIDDELCTSQKYEWCDDGIKSFIKDNSMQKLPWVEYSPNVYDAMKNNRPYQNIEKKYDAFEQIMLISQDIKSILMIPIFVNNQFHCFIGFDDCIREESWEEVEINFLKTIVNSISIFKKHKESQEKSKHSDMKYKTILELFPFPVMAYELDGSVKFINKIAHNDIGLPIKKILKMNMIDFFPVGNKKVYNLLKERLLSLHEGKSYYTNAFNMTNSGTDFEVTTKIIYDGKKPDYKISVIRDITEEKNKTLKLEQLVEQKARSIKEMHHRIKNNLSVVQGLLDLQFHSEMDDFDHDDIAYLKLKKIVDDAKRRILAISLVHKMFYNYSDNDVIELSTFIQELLEYIADIFYDMKSKISIELNITDINLSLDQAIPCGLIINEIISNAYKYAFIGRDSGKIGISLTNDDTHFIIKISDNGIGLPEKFKDLDESFGNSSSIGFSLIRGLSAQLFGSLKLDSSKEGTKFTLKIPKKK